MTAIESRDSEWLAHRYLDAKSHVIEAGFSGEIDWQEERHPRHVSETDLLSQACWVVLSCGMSERVVRGVFTKVSRAFFEFSSAAAILRSERRCRREALQVFNSPAKIDAILAFARTTEAHTPSGVVQAIEINGPDWLCSLPFFGPATSRHLAKNLGIQIAKPDRHLKRLAELAGYPSVAGLCDSLAALTGDSVPVIDIVLWRYATLRSKHELELTFA